MHKTIFFFRRCKWTKLQAAGVFLHAHTAPFKIQTKFEEASLLEAGEQFPWGRFGSSLQCNWITGNDRMLAPRSSPNALSEGNRALATETHVHKEVMNHLLSWVLLVRELHKKTLEVCKSGVGDKNKTQPFMRQPTSLFQRLYNIHTHFQLNKKGIENKHRKRPMRSLSFFILLEFCNKSGFLIQFVSSTQMGNKESACLFVLSHMCCAGNRRGRSCTAMKTFWREKPQNQYTLCSAGKMRRKRSCSSPAATELDNVAKGQQSSFGLSGFFFFCTIKKQELLHNKSVRFREWFIKYVFSILLWLDWERNILHSSSVQAAWGMILCAVPALQRSSVWGFSRRNEKQMILTRPAQRSVRKLTHEIAILNVKSTSEKFPKKIEPLHGVCRWFITYC